jgi:endoglucanase
VPGVTGYDLMNEPGQLSRSAREGAAIWEAASQQAVTAIRATGDRHLVAVEGYGGSAPERFVELHPNAWIHDPAHAVRYEIHQYFDSDGSGHYNSSFAQETEAAAAAQPKGARRCAAAVADRRAGTEPVPGGPDGGTS